MDWRSFDTDNCSVAGAVEIFGDRASLLVLRESFMGVRRFADFQRNTRLARNILADRLQRLVGEGILERRQYLERPPRDEYRLTPKGLDLYGVMIGLMAWGNKYGPATQTGPAVLLRHKGCGAVAHPHLACPACGEAVTARDMEALPGPGAVLKQTA